MLNRIKQAFSSLFNTQPAVPETVVKGWGLIVRITGPKPPYEMVYCSKDCPTFTIISSDGVESQADIPHALLCLLQDEGYVSDVITRSRVVPELTGEGLYLNALPCSGTNSRLLMAYTTNNHHHECRTKADRTTLPVRYTSPKHASEQDTCLLRNR